VQLFVVCVNILLWTRVGENEQIFDAINHSDDNADTESEPTRRSLDIFEKKSP
jgi:hypothetical protein